MRLLDSWSYEPCSCEQDRFEFLQMSKALHLGLWSEEFMAIIFGSQAMITNQ